MTLSDARDENVVFNREHALDGVRLQFAVDIDDLRRSGFLRVLLGRARRAAFTGGRRVLPMSLLLRLVARLRSHVQQRAPRLLRARLHTTRQTTRNLVKGSTHDDWSRLLRPLLRRRLGLGR